MRMDHDPAPRSIFPRFGFRYWPKTVIRSKCSEWLLRAQSPKCCKASEWLTDIQINLYTVKGITNLKTEELKML